MAIIGFQITEKSNNLAHGNKYCLWVDKKDSKSKIRLIVEKQFNVKVEAVNIINLKGKYKSWRQRSGKKKDRKKAIVTLKKGQKIKEFEVSD